VAGTVPLALGWIPQWRVNDGRPELCGAGDVPSKSAVSPNQSSYAVAELPLGVADGAVVMVGLEAVELEDKGVPVDEPLVGGTAVVAAQPEHVLVPPAGCFDIAHGDERLGLGPAADGDGHANAVAGGVVALDEVALAAVGALASL
jgi:hypothetical protein